MVLELTVIDLGGGCKSIRAVGEILQAEAASFEEKIGAVLSLDPATVLINLNRVTSISSAGIGVLMACLSNPDRPKSRIIIVCAKGAALDALKLMGLLDVAPIAGTEEEALKLIAKEDSARRR